MLFVAVAALVVPALVSAQEAEPLQKSDIIRLLSGTNYAQDEIAGIIRQSCLTFSPTARDQSDFRGLGAADSVMQAIADCGQRTQGTTVAVSSRGFTAAVGQQVTLTATATRNGVTASGIDLVLRGSGSIAGSTGRNLTAQTDGDGRATFRIPAGTAVRTYNLSVEAASGATQGSRSITLRVTAGAGATVSLSPSDLGAESDVTRRTLQVRVSDDFGNPASATELTFVDDSGVVLATETTGPDGMLTVVFPLRMLRDVSRVTVRSGDSNLGSVAVGHDQPDETGTRFVSGTGQAADAGTTLAESLVLEVRDASGAAVVGLPVTFRTEGGGEAAPANVTTDDAGRAETSVTLGSAGRSTRVVAVIAGFEVSTDFEITVGGMTGSAFAAQLAAASAALNSGDPQAAADLYGELHEADPANLDAMIGYGLALSALERYEEAADLLRAALRIDPTRLDAQKGLAAAALELDQDSEAARWYGVAVTQSPNDVEAWVGLGEARAAGGRNDEARTAFERALAIDPDNEAALRGIAGLSGSARIADFQLWGGYTSDNGRDPGIRMLRVEVWPVRTFALWITYDNGLYIDKNWMVRGPDDIEGIFGGISLDWGSADQLTTKFEFGRRNRTHTGPQALIETDYFLDQKVRFGSGNWWNIGGYLGHYGPYDDDWGVHTEVAFAPAGNWTLKPTLSYVKNIGSDFSQVHDFVKATEFRLGLDALYETQRGAGGGLAVNYGNVDSEVDTFDGGLWEGRLLGYLPLGQASKVLAFVRYQAPPGMDSFVSFFLGFDLAIPR